MTLRILIFCLASMLSLPASAALMKRDDRPNVVLIMTDDQGHGDLGFHGNPKIRTPNLDKLATESVRFDNFYVSPVCAPTRASLMTGRYNFRTGVVDTWLGRALMHGDEVTVAEMLAEAGYRTGIFGKWHLGDNYPMRPMDQGFGESLVHMGGGIAQPSDPPGNTYFNPTLQQNGKTVETKGYCSGVFTQAAIKFISKNKRQPFFLYLPYNAPHTPLQVPEVYHRTYAGMNLANSEFPQTGHPLPPEQLDNTARVYGMVENIDDNVGDLLDHLDSLKLREKTVVIFLTDNGPQQPRYNSGMRDRKGSVYEGGIRVPMFVRWPGKYPAGRKYNLVSAHIDIAPTILEMCEVPVPNNVLFDGISLGPLLNLKPETKLSWPNRTLFFQWHRGDKPERYRAFAARSQTFKLVQALGKGNQPLPTTPNFELFDMRDDPLEQNNVAAQHPEVVKDMKGEYDRWFDDVSATRGYEAPWIHLGSIKENLSTLTRQDWRGPQASWRPEGLGYWESYIERSGSYEFKLRFPALQNAASVHLKIGEIASNARVSTGATEQTFKSVKLAEGYGRVEAWIDNGLGKVGVHYIDVRRVRR